MGSPLGAATGRLTEDGVSCEAECLSEVSERDRRWDQRRVSAEVLEEIFYGFAHPTFAKWSPRLKNCAQVLEFGWSPDRQHEGVLSLKLKRSWFCKVPLCPVCMWRKSLMKTARLYSALPKILEDYPNHGWIFFTFTVKNVEVSDLRSELKSLHQSFARLTKRVEWARCFEGWLRTTEITKGKDGPMKAHPHMHVLALVKGSYFSRFYVNQLEWRGIWKSCARLDYDPTLYVKRVDSENRNGRKSAGDLTGEALRNEIRKAIVEVGKYVLKPSDIDFDNAEFIQQVAVEIRKIRMMAIGGVLREYMKDDPATQKELIAGDGDGEGSELNPGGVHYTWRSGRKRYVYDGSWS